MPINSFIYPSQVKLLDYEVANSCRLNRGDSPYMSKTHGSAGNQRTFTVSFWYKRTNFGEKEVIMSTTDGGSSFFSIGFTGSGTYVDKFFIYWYDGSSPATDYGYFSTRLFRDVSAWYHVVLAVDTTQGTESDRVKLYINGTLESLTAVYAAFPENHDTYFNKDNVHYIAYDHDSASAALNGYLAELVIIDGTQYAASDFGEFDEDSPTIWKPIDVSGLTFGTNGAYLDFEDSSNLGNDANGGTDWTESNLAATDQSTDTPTNNFATLNPLYNNSLVYAEGNCKITEAGDWQSSFSTIGATSGKWYMEFKCSASTDGADNFSGGICALDGVSDAAIALTVPGGSGSSIISYGYENDATKDVKNTSSSYGSTYGSASTDIIGVYMDLDNNKLYFAKNGTVQDSGTGISIDDGYTYGFTVGDYYGTSEANFGNPTFSISSGNADANGYGNFEYDPSSGTFDSASKDFYALCTKNLAEYG